MIQAKETYKEELSKHVEGIFKKYVKPGLHICDIATGGGKSYTIGKLTCEYYPKHFDRIVILCVQNKLVEGMNREIDRFIDLQDSLIKEDQKLVIENNTEVIKKAISNVYGGNRATENGIYSVVPMFLEANFFKRPATGIYKFENKQNTTSNISKKLYIQSFLLNNSINEIEEFHYRDPYFNFISI